MRGRLKQVNTAMYHLMVPKFSIHKMNNIIAHERLAVAGRFFRMQKPPAISWWLNHHGNRDEPMRHKHSIPQSAGYCNIRRITAIVLGAGNADVES